MLLEFRDIDHSGAFTKSGGGGPKTGATPTRSAALYGGNYFRNLPVLLLDRDDIGCTEFGAWLARTEEPPSLTLHHLEKWLDRTKASVAEQHIFCEVSPTGNRPQLGDHLVCMTSCFAWKVKKL